MADSKNTEKNQKDSASSAAPAGADDRRDFVTKLLAGGCGAVAGLVPLGSGVAVLLDPLRRTADSGGFLRVATLDSVPADGIPRMFPVLSDRSDAWNRYLNEPIGAVYLRREPGSDAVQCFNAICPHAGCSVDYEIPEKRFHCPCHDSNWQAGGERIKPESCPSPRDLDTLDVDPERLKDGEVWVDFKNFLTATPEKIPKA